MESELKFHLERVCQLLNEQFKKEITDTVTKVIDEKLKSIGVDTYSDGLIDTPGLQKLLSLSKSSIEILKNEKMPFYKIGSSVRFNKQEVLEFIYKYRQKVGRNAV